MGCPFHRNDSGWFWKKIKDLFRRVIKEPSVFSSKNLAAILETTVDTIVTINEKSIVLAFNQAAEKTFGYTKEEIIGKSVTLLMPEPFHSQHDSYVQNYIKTGIKKIIGIGREAIGKRKDGSVFPIFISVSEVFTESERLFTAIIQDLTEEKQSEEIVKSNIRLEGEIAAKNEYISILGHELRTPLTAIYGSLSLLNKQSDLLEKVHELVSIAFRNTERLLHVINEVLDVTKIQSGRIKIELAPISISPLIEEAISFSKPFAEQLDVQLVFTPPTFDITILADYDRLIQVMMNILSNAIKFSPQHAKIIITVELMESVLRVAVQDFGKGIPLTFHERIFTPFSQSSSRARVAGGSGLGLYICKLIMEQLHGKIDYTTKENEGTTFFVEIPIYKGTS